MDSQTKSPVWANQPGPSGQFINSVAVNNDATRILGAAFYHQYSGMEPPPPDPTYGTYCLDQTGKTLWSNPMHCDEGVYWVTITPDGTYAASGGVLSLKPKNGFIRAFDGATGKVLLDFKTGARCNQVSLSQDGQWLLAGADELYLFQLVEGAYQKTDMFEVVDRDSIYTAVISADGSLVACGDYLNSSIYLFSNMGGKLKQVACWAMPHPEPVDPSKCPYSHRMAITPDGKTLVASGAKGNIYLFDCDEFIKTQAPTLTYLIPEKGEIYGIAITDDGNTVAAGCNHSDKGIATCFQRSGSTATLLWSMPTERNPNFVRINEETGIVAIADGHPGPASQPMDNSGNFYCIEAQTGVVRWKYHTEMMNWAVGISGNGNAIIGGSNDSHLYYFTP